MDYAIIKLGNKQHRVRHGETLVVDRLRTDAGETFEPVVLLGEGTVTATVIAHERGPKILVGKYRKRTGYKRHNGFRAATSRVEISLGGGDAQGSKAAEAPAPAEPTIAAPEVVASDVVAPDVAPDVVAPDVVAPDVGQSEVATLAAPASRPVGAEGAALPGGYDVLTVTQVAAAARDWSHDEIEAALAFEQAHAARKGALSALEAALAKEDG